MRAFTGRYQRVDQAEFFGLCWTKGFTFHQIGLRAQQPQVARHFGHAAGAWQQAQRYFGQAKRNFAVVNGNAMVANERHFPAATQRRAAQEADHGLAQGFQGAKVAFDLLNFSKHGGRVLGANAHGGFEVGPGKKRGFCGGEQDAANRVFVLQHLGGERVHIVFPLRAHGVDGRAWLVKSYGGNAVLELVLDCFHA